MSKHAKPGVREGDMVVCKLTNVIGLLEGLRMRPGGCVIQEASNFYLYGFNWYDLRQATPAEIAESGLCGIGCNPYRE